MEYSEKQLRISLNDFCYQTEKIDGKILQEFLGGVGYAAKVLYDELDKGIDPLSPDNKLVFATGPLTSYRVPGGGSIEICYKSPLTNAWGEARCGGNFGPDLKKAGYDFIIFEGKASKPIYLFINNGQINFKDAKHLLGKMVSEKTKIIRKELRDDSISVMCIGIAGEKLVHIASVMFEGRSAGRCGAGAVMGSKNLIAVAVKGSARLEVKNPNELKAVLKDVKDVLKESEIAQSFRQFGTIWEYGW